MEAVVDATLEDLRIHAEGLCPDTIFLGGGTPTHLPPELLERLLRGLHRYCDLSHSVEFSSEANPESCSQEQVEILATHGVTRISVGVQSFDPERLRFLDRPHDPEQAIEALQRIQERSNLELSLDLIFALPQQQSSEWYRDLEIAIHINPSHISCYNLTFEPGTKLFGLRERGKVAEAPEELGRELFLGTRERLGAEGFDAYEISNFARDGKRCEHNLGYWRGWNYVGVGPGASGHRDGRRSRRLPGPRAYVDAISRTGNAELEAETLSPEHRFREAIWLGLRLSEGVDLGRVAELVGVDLASGCEEAIRDSEQAGHLERDGAQIRLSPEGQLFADQVACRFL